jgi:hypothetical protein
MTTTQLEKYIKETFPGIDNQFLFLDLINKIKTGANGSLFIFRCKKGMGGGSTCLRILNNAELTFTISTNVNTVGGLRSLDQFKTHNSISQSDNIKKIKFPFISDLLKHKIVILEFLYATDEDYELVKKIPNTFILDFDAWFIPKEFNSSTISIANELKNCDINLLKFAIFVDEYFYKFSLLLSCVIYIKDIRCYIINTFLVQEK